MADVLQTTDVDTMDLLLGDCRRPGVANCLPASVGCVIRLVVLLLFPVLFCSLFVPGVTNWRLQGPCMLDSIWLKPSPQARVLRQQQTRKTGTRIRRCWKRELSVVDDFDANSEFGPKKIYLPSTYIFHVARTIYLPSMRLDSEISSEKILFVLTFHYLYYFSHSQNTFFNASYSAFFLNPNAPGWHAEQSKARLTDQLYYVMFNYYRFPGMQLAHAPAGHLRKYLYSICTNLFSLGWKKSIFFKKCVLWGK